MTRFLIDNSVLQRLPRNLSIQLAIRAILEADDELCSCAWTLDEFADSARSAAEHRESTDRMRSSFLFLHTSPETDHIVAELRSALWAAGKGRAAGVVDLAIAAVAIRNQATVLHYDSDFDHLSDVYPALSTQWAVPRDSVN